MRESAVAGVLFAATCAVYWNALPCGFVFDDVSAIRENKDLRPTTPLLQLFRNDFWGTPMVDERSHKSYRPLTVLTFRWNYALGQLDPVGYHLVNVLLHGAVTVLFYVLLRRHLVSPGDSETALAAAVLFAWHPIHTEAVTGVVGRAELLAGASFLLTLLAYMRCCLCARGNWRHWAWFGVACLWTAVGTLCKEQAVTVVGVCFVHEVMLVHKMTFHKLGLLARMLFGGGTSSGSGGSSSSGNGATNNNSNSHGNNHHHHHQMKNSSGGRGRHSERWTVLLQLRQTILRCLTLLGFLAGLLYLRINVMGAKLPFFTNFDNPAAHASTPVRQLTYNYLLPINAWLLIFPLGLCCDWTMGTVPLITGWTDPRNAYTLIFYFALCALGFYSLKEKGDTPKFVGLALAISAISFLPASNLFFPVGFVVAERILYTPSMGYCILLAIGIRSIGQRCPRGAKAALVSILVFYGGRTVARNYDWKDENTLFKAGLKFTSTNAKLWNNVGHSLEGIARFDEALPYFLHAAKVQPDDIGAHINVGRTYSNLGRYRESEEAYKMALAYFPQPIKGKRYTTRIAPGHLKVFINLSNLLVKNSSRLEEADAFLLRAISMRPDYVEAYQNRGDILLRLGRPQEAKAVYETALVYQPGNADLHYNLGVVFMELRDRSAAFAAFERALALNPDHEHALYNSAVYLSDAPDATLERKLEARRRFQRVFEVNAGHSQAHFSMAMLETDFRNFMRAEHHYVESLSTDPTSRSALFNLALLYYNELKRPNDALTQVRALLKHHPNHVKGYLLLGDLYLNVLKDVIQAEIAFRRAHEIEPTSIQALHNLCVVLVTKGDLHSAKACLTKALTLAPKDLSIQEHLGIVEQRIKDKAAT